MGNIYSNGVSQGDLYSLISDINTKFIALLTQLVADAIVNTSTYLTGCTSGSLPSSFTGTGVNQKQIVDWLQSYITGWNAMLALLDADTGIAATDYVATYAITDAINPASATAHQIRNDGMYQGDLVYFLNLIITNLNAVNAVLDADALQLSDYVTNFNVTDTVFV